MLVSIVDSDLAAQANIASPMANASNADVNGGIALIGGCDCGCVQGTNCGCIVCCNVVAC